MKKSKQKKYLRVILSLIVISGIVSVIFIFKDKLKRGRDSLSQAGQLSVRACPQVQEEIKTVRGNSLEPVINNGEEIKILFGYYGCFLIKREDIVAYNHAGQTEPIIKIIKAVPGDRFELKKNDAVWNILVNGGILKNSLGEPYLLDQGRYNMLHLYEEDSSGVIPKDVYLILGNVPSGTLDSTQFGLVHKSEVLGKVIK